MNNFLLNKSPLILTLRLAEPQQAFFDRKRKAHYPAYANFLQAHLTLFHHLPAAEPAIAASLIKFSKKKNITLQVTGLKNMGNGVAYHIVSRELSALHRSMQKVFAPWLIPQDKQQLWPHITIQNKVTSYKAQLLYEQLNDAFIPFEVTATGIDSWLYLHGPWMHVNTYMFNDPTE